MTDVFTWIEEISGRSESSDACDSTVAALKSTMVASFKVTLGAEI